MYIGNGKLCANVTGNFVSFAGMLPAIFKIFKPFLFFHLFIYLFFFHACQKRELPIKMTCPS